MISALELIFEGTAAGFKLGYLVHLSRNQSLSSRYQQIGNAYIHICILFVKPCINSFEGQQGDGDRNSWQKIQQET